MKIKNLYIIACLLCFVNCNNTNTAGNNQSLEKNDSTGGALSAVFKKTEAKRPEVIIEKDFLYKKKYS